MNADSHYQSEVLRLRREVAALQVQRALLRLALKAYLQPRSAARPGRQRAGWAMDKGRGAGASQGQDTSDDTASDGEVQLAGDIPQNDTPEIPEERPPTSSERTGILRQLASGPANWLHLLTLPQWLYTSLPSIISYNDPPRSLEELQQNVANPQPGYQIHHIVEQGSAEADGFPRSQIDAPENLVRVPTIRHWDINGWYQRQNPDYGGISPREYLRDRSWDERMGVGLNALEIFGVLQR